MALRNGSIIYAKQFVPAPVEEDGLLWFHQPSRTIRSSRDGMLRRAVFLFLEMARQGVGKSHTKCAFHRDAKTSDGSSPPPPPIRNVGWRRTQFIRGVAHGVFPSNVFSCAVCHTETKTAYATLAHESSPSPSESNQIISNNATPELCLRHAYSVLE